MFVVPRPVPCRFSEDNFLSRQADFVPPKLQMSLRLDWTAGANGQRQRFWIGPSIINTGTATRQSLVVNLCWGESEFELMCRNWDSIQYRYSYVRNPEVLGSDYERLIPRKARANVCDPGPSSL